MSEFAPPAKNGCLEFPPAAKSEVDVWVCLGSGEKWMSRFAGPGENRRLEIPPLAKNGCLIFKVAKMGVLVLVGVSAREKWVSFSSNGAAGAQFRASGE
jgi:hypothetical protein